MSAIVALQMDAPEHLRPAGDTTIMLAEEALRRGYELWHYTPRDMAICEGRVMVSAAPVSFDIHAEKWVSFGPRERRDLSKASIVLLRQDPPFDMQYLTSTWMLEALPKKVKVLNDPFHVRNNPEKIFPLQFPEFCPPTLVTADADEIAHFRNQHRDIVIKPLYGYGGAGVFRLRAEDGNFHALMETLLAPRDAVLVVQSFLPEIEQGDRRIMMIAGKVAGAFARMPAKGEIRANLRVGGSAVPMDLTAGQRKICEALGPVLREKNLMLAGIDVIGDKLIEINITSPTGLRQLKALYDSSPERDFWDAVEALYPAFLISEASP